VFNCFLEWKALVEKCSGKKLKTLRSNNGDEYTSKIFNDYLKAEGIRHECTIPRTPEQNGVAQRLNPNLVESACSILMDAKTFTRVLG
jgi:transposase InsO family protein